MTMDAPVASYGDKAFDRFLRLEGATNFRDMGGLSAQNGRVAFGTLYRSDSLSDLTGSDCAAVEALGLRTIYDLRTAREREKAPNCTLADVRVWQSPADAYHPGVVSVARRVREAISQDRFDAETTEGWFLQRYELFARDDLAPFQVLAQDLLREEAFPALIHCASGKDRTGFAVAMILMALGVADTEIVQDYLLSNRNPRSFTHHFSPDSPAEPLAFLAGVRESFLLAAFAAIDREWESRDRFLAEGLGWGHRERAYLRLRLIEPERTMVQLSETASDS